MPTILTNNAKINYMQLAYKGDGEAEDLILVHGLAANMAFWLQDYAKQFTSRFRVTLYDLRGHGRSQITPNGYKPDDMGNDLRCLLDNLAIDKAHILAHSFGGVVAMNFACNFPGRILSLVLADTHISIGRALGKEQKWQTGETIAHLLKQNGIDLDTNHPYFGYHMLTAIAGLRCADKDIPEQLTPWVKWIFGEHNKRTAQKWLQLMEQTSANTEILGTDGLSKERLLKIYCPILAMYGEKSQSMATGNFLQSIWPNAQFEIIKNGGHFFPRAMPDLIIAMCEEFWQQIENCQETRIENRVKN